MLVQSFHISGNVTLYGLYHVIYLLNDFSLYLRDNEKIISTDIFNVYGFIGAVNIERRNFRRCIPFVTLALAASEPVTNVR